MARTGKHMPADTEKHIKRIHRHKQAHTHTQFYYGYLALRCLLKVCSVIPKQRHKTSIFILMGGRPRSSAESDSTMLLLLWLQQLFLIVLMHMQHLFWPTFTFCIFLPLFVSDPSSSAFSLQVGWREKSGDNRIWQATRTVNKILSENIIRVMLVMLLKWVSPGGFHCLWSYVPKCCMALFVNVSQQHWCRFCGWYLYWNLFPGYTTVLLS